MNAFPQFRAEVGGLGIHFIHQRGRGPAPFPLVITHGWPGSVAEFAKIIGPLTDPAVHGAANPTDGLTQEELTAMLELQRFRKEESGYQSIQGTKPQTLAYGLNDSPAGLAAWIVEKFRAWSDCGGEIERRFRFHVCRT